MFVRSSLRIVLTLPLALLAQQAPPSGRCRPVPDSLNLTPLPDPFTFLDGDAVLTKEDWACRQAEISDLLQRYQLGPLPTTQPIVKGTLWAIPNSTAIPYRLNITVTESMKSIEFNVPFLMPAEQKEGEGPIPAIVAIGSSSIPSIPGVAVIAFNNDLIAQQMGTSSRGKGLFYDLYGADHPAGSLIAWAWGVGRLIDALEQVQEENPIIDAARLGVTGCSRNGKGALVIGAFEPRIKLTIPQEGGAGGVSCWRLQDELTRRGVSTQTAAQIVTENTWFGRAFEAYVRQVGVLPFDQHLLSALIAPRAFYVAENGGIDWLGPESAWGCQRAARTVWKALGVEDRIGFGQTAPGAGHNHCMFPVKDQLPGLAAFIDRFLKAEEVETESFFETKAQYPEYTDEFWIKWKTPNLV